MRQFYTFICAVCFAVAPVLAQDFAAIDRHATELKSVGSLDEVAAALLAPCQSDVEKARAIYTYTATHVKYDCKEFHREVADRKAKTRPEIVARAHSQGLGVCIGYAMLFDELCKKANLQSEVVTGYARISSNPPNPGRLPSNHAWNAVKLDGVWHLMDATWGSGLVNDEVTKFTAKFNDYYFMPPAERLFRTHWPDNPQWQCFETPRTAEAFADQPHLSRLPDHIQLFDFAPQSGLIQRGQDTYTFRVKVEGAQVLKFKMGEKFIPMTQTADGYWEYTVPLAQLRGSRFTVVYLEENFLYPIVEYRLSRS